MKSFFFSTVLPSGSYASQLCSRNQDTLTIYCPAPRCNENCGCKGNEGSTCAMGASGCSGMALGLPDWTFWQPRLNIQYLGWDGDEAVLILDSKPWSGMILEATHLEHMVCRSVFNLLGIYIVHLHLLAVRCSLKSWLRREVSRRKLGKGLTSFDSTEIVSNCT